MQAQTISRKKIIGILIILGLLLAMYFALKLARQAQDIRKRAAGTGDILLTLDPTAKSAAKGEAFNVKIVMKNNATSPKTISTAGVDLDFDPALFTVSAINCGSNFPSAGVSRVDTAAKKIYLTCFVGAGSPAYSMAAGSQADLGSFTLTVGSSVPTTSTDLSFARTNVADSVTYADQSNPGTKATYNVGVVSPTISPTASPIPTLTLVPSPTSPGGQTLVVCPATGTGCDYVGASGIQNALDAILDGGTVLIKNGLYTGSRFWIGTNSHPAKHNVTITGESLNAVLDGTGGDEILFIGSDSIVTVNSLTLKKAPTNGIHPAYSSRVTITNNNIEQNYSGIYVNNSATVVVNGNTIKDNLASGISLTDSSTSTISNNTINHNATSNTGDGISIWSSATATISNNVITRNIRDGVWVASSAPVILRNNTIFGNTREGIDSNGSAQLTVVNTISTDNGLRGVLGFAQGNFTRLEYNDSFNNTGGNWSQGSGWENWPPATNVSVNPLFVDAENGNFHLQSGSPACTGGENGGYMGVYPCEVIIPTPTLTPSPTVVVSETPVPSITPTGTLVPTITPTPTPPSGQEAYTIDIGTKAVLSINIGSGNTPQIKFTAKLAGAEGHPDMYFKLRAKDDLAFVNNPNSGPTCESPGAGGVDLYVPMKADNSGIYSPVTGINISAPAGAVVAPVSSDGWVSLTGLSAGKYYTLNLKGAKTRGTDMLEHVLLAGGQSASQNYDWTDNGLQPGDLPDPNNSNKQDCTVNSVDISLINSRLGRTDPDSLNIADVSYDGVVNANDIAQVVGTLSTKPDDDN